LAEEISMCSSSVQVGGTQKACGAGRRSSAVAPLANAQDVEFGDFDFDASKPIDKRSMFKFLLR
jgi:hypothetical protein